MHFSFAVMLSGVINHIKQQIALWRDTSTVLHVDLNNLQKMKDNILIPRKWMTDFHRVPMPSFAFFCFEINLQTIFLL